MGLNKRKRIFYNLVVGILGKILLLILGFLVPKLYIENYGSEINGLLSSIAQVFFYLSLLEAGIGTAATELALLFSLLYSRLLLTLPLKVSRSFC